MHSLWRCTENDRTNVHGLDREGVMPIHVLPQIVRASRVHLTLTVRWVGKEPEDRHRRVKRHQHVSCTRAFAGDAVAVSECKCRRRWHVCRLAGQHLHVSRHAVAAGNNATGGSSST